MYVDVFFQALTRPSAANKSFPYHVRTTQVGAASAYNHANGNSVERINDTHAYAPSYVDASGRTVDIFTVSGVLQVFDPVIVDFSNNCPINLRTEL